MFGAFAAHCKSYHPVLKEKGLMCTDGAMQRLLKEADEPPSGVATTPTRKV